MYQRAVPGDVATVEGEGDELEEVDFQGSDTSSSVGSPRTANRDYMGRLAEQAGQHVLGALRATVANSGRKVTLSWSVT